MQATIQKWGNSQGIRIPKAFLEAVGMSENDRVSIDRVNNTIVITKCVPDKELTLEKIFDSYDGDYKPTEYNWGEPVGKEVW